MSRTEPVFAYISLLQVDDDEEESYSNEDEDPFHGDIALVPTREKIRMNRRPMSITRGLRAKLNERALSLSLQEEQEDLSDNDFKENERISILS